MRKKNTFWHKLLLFTGFAGPAAFCFIMVMIVPFFYGIYLTLTGWDGISAVKDFVGLENYYTVFTEAEFWRSVLLTVIYSAISVVLVNVLAFALAYGVTGGGKSQNGKCRRTVFSAGKRVNHRSRSGQQRSVPGSNYHAVPG